MPQQTPSQARVIDPILTEVARGYRSNKAPVANILFPTVPVGQRGGRILSFSPEDFRIYSTARAPGASTRRVQFGHSSLNYSLVDYSLEGSVPIELQQEAQAVPGIDLASNAVRKVQNLQALEREKQAADLATNAALYAGSNKTTLSGTSQWNDAASNPFSDLLAAKEVVRQQTGERPNTLVLGPKVLTGLRSNPKVLDRLSTASDRPPATLAQLAALFEIENIVEGAMSSFDSSNNTMVDVWGRYALLAYTDAASADEMGSPNFGYTYQLSGMPVVEEPYYDRNTKTWYFPVTDARQPVLVGPSAGFLFTNAVA